MESIVITAAVVGMVEFFKRLKDQDWHGVAVIAGAAAVGIIAGYLGLEGLNPISGFIAGLSAAGVYKVGAVVAGR